MDPLMTLTWLEATPLAGVMRQFPWSYPLVQTAHILGFILVKGAAAKFDLRLLGSTPRLPVVDVAGLAFLLGGDLKPICANPVAGEGGGSLLVALDHHHRARPVHGLHRLNSSGGHGGDTRPNPRESFPPTWPIPA